MRRNECISLIGAQIHSHEHTQVMRAFCHCFEAKCVLHNKKVVCSNTDLTIGVHTHIMIRCMRQVMDRWSLAAIGVASSRVCDGTQFCCCLAANSVYALAVMQLSLIGALNSVR